ncbi:flavodoxin domain-containing protein [Actinoplanes sp. NPDC026670]|uniref:flavodoxin family protein n=1 Tax=Actinoplanes sp. NPDC026670 TaxID=3154700 RepID=UPI0033EB79AC
MKALVVYESMFGNTAEIAAAVARGLSDSFDVTLTDVHDVPPAAGVDLLVLGAPTHAFGMSRPSTRADATNKGEVRPGAEKVGIREFLDRSPQLTGLAAVAFDTKVNRPMTGSAARKALRRLRALGCRTVAPAESFHVTGMTGPLVTGEADRARDWARNLAASLASQAA